MSDRPTFSLFRRQVVIVSQRHGSLHNNARGPPRRVQMASRVCPRSSVWPISINRWHSVSLASSRRLSPRFPWSSVNCLPLRRRKLHSTTNMSAASTSTALYAAVVSPAQLAGAEPEDAKELRHHLKGGKGFHNPWASFQDRSPFYFFRNMGLYGRHTKVLRVQH